MTEKELEEFAELWLAACENSGFKTEPSDAAINLAFDILIDYSLGDIAIAIVKHQRIPNEPLTPAIIESLITGSFWLSADEAWQVALKTFDLAQSVVITHQILKSAQDVELMYNGGERTAAKAAFVKIYERMMMTAVALGQKPVWFIYQLECPTRENSTDMANRKAVSEAISSGYITKTAALKLGYDVSEQLPQNTMQKLLQSAPDDAAKKAIEDLRLICQLGIANE
jgi:hypothetical protein